MVVPRVKGGDLIAVPFAEGRVAAGLVLLRSRGRFKGCLLVGFYERAFSSVEEVAVADLGGPFIATPQYLHQWRVRRGEWPVVNHRGDLLAAAEVPILRVSYDLYRGDDHVRRVAEEEVDQYESLRVQGDGYVEEVLRRHFLGGSPRLDR